MSDKYETLDIWIRPGNTFIYEGKNNASNLFERITVVVKTTDFFKWKYDNQQRKFDCKILELQNEISELLNKYFDPGELFIYDESIDIKLILNEHYKNLNTQ